MSGLWCVNSMSSQFITHTRARTHTHTHITTPQGLIPERQCANVVEVNSPNLQKDTMLQSISNGKNVVYSIISVIYITLNVVVSDIQC